MRKQKFVVPPGVSLHGDAATRFVNLASSFLSTIKIEKGNKKINAKSLLGLSSLDVSAGMTITITAEGNDEKNAVRTLVDFINKRCPENYSGCSVCCMYTED